MRAKDNVNAVVLKRDSLGKPDIAENAQANFVLPFTVDNALGLSITGERSCFHILSKAKDLLGE